MESYLSRCARVLASVRSLTPTKSMSAPAAFAARKRLRPMRPKPLMPTRTAMGCGAPRVDDGAEEARNLPEPLPGVRCDAVRRLCAARTPADAQAVLRHSTCPAHGRPEGF